MTTFTIPALPGKFIATGARGVAILAIAAVVAPSQAPATVRAGPPPFSWIEVVPGVYATVEPRALALSPFVHGNSVFVVTDSEVVAFDANHAASAARATLTQLRAVTANPVRTLALSHWHGDHTLGIQAFVDAFPGIRIIATDSTRNDMVRAVVPLAKRTAADMEKINRRYDSLATAGVDLAGRPLTPARREQWRQTRDAYRRYYSPEALEFRIYPPTTTFAREMTLWSGSTEIQLLSFGRGDTRGDAVLWLPRERVLATGDVLVDPAPYSGAQHPGEWLEFLRSMRALNPLHIVPGHGNVMHDTKYLDLVIAATDSTIRVVRRLAAADPALTEDAMAKRVTMEEFRQQFTHGDPLTDDRWLDFVDGLVRGAFLEARGTSGRK
ncbi:MAG: MBL fold metallo-hydrolase [Gemmatimonadaceae bacterium]